jgi:hypothetical protein
LLPDSEGLECAVENYEHSALRHYSDAEHLLAASRRENCDHHYGIAAECALKLALTFSVSKGALAKVPHLHINEGLWEAALLQLQAKRYPGLIPLLKAKNPFSDWDVSQRYFPNGYAPVQAVEAHRKAARRLIGAVGLVPA